MTHPMYVHVSLLNRLRATYLGPIIACDAPLYMQAPAGSAVFAWVRGCDCTSRPNECVLVALNMDVTGGGARVDLDTPWSGGTRAVDVISGADAGTVAGGGTLALTLAPYAAALLVPSSRVTPIAPIVNSVAPPHDALVAAADLSAINLGFESPVSADAIEALEIDGASILTPNWCPNAEKCAEIAVPSPRLGPGIHHLELRFRGRSSVERVGGVFKSRFRVIDGQQPHDVIVDPTVINRRDPPPRCTAKMHRRAHIPAHYN